MCLDIIVILEDHPMENRNLGSGNPQSQNRETVCIDTYRVLDSCRDRDCYEDVRVYLTEYGQEIISNTSSVRATKAKILWSYVGVDPVTFNRGFYRISVKTYIMLTLEACNGMGTAQEFCGLAVLEKSVILYGGEGDVSAYRSTPGGSYCEMFTSGSVSSCLPIAVVESAPPLVLSVDVRRSCSCGCNDDTNCCNNIIIPDAILEYFDGPLVNEATCQLYIGIGIFSIIRIERPAQLLVQACDYSVPDKECRDTDGEDACSAFRKMPFPTDVFTTDGTLICRQNQENGNNGGCGCRSHGGKGRG